MTSYKSLAILGSLLLLIGVISCKSSRSEPEWVTRSMKTAQAQIKSNLQQVLLTGTMPRSSERGLRTTDDWTSGFYAGTLWYLYKYTHDDYWLTNARAATELLAGQQYRDTDHDIGFVVFCSYGNGWLATDDKNYRALIIEAANTLVAMYNPKTRTTRSWPPNEKRDWKYPVIIDNMMNLELLMEAHKMTGEDIYRRVAIAHADRTMECQFRSDYSCAHVVDYDPATGEFRKMDWNNGDNNPQTSVWSRGQGWAVYGYTMMYRQTENKKYLTQAQNIVNFILSHPNMPEDMIPYWDLSAPHKSTMRDASAAALIASALLELSTYGDSDKRYFTAAEKMLITLSSPEYLAEPGTNSNFILKHATGNFLANSELDAGLVYADYYFVEALNRYLDILRKNTK